MNKPICYFIHCLSFNCYSCFALFETTSSFTAIVDEGYLVDYTMRWHQFHVPSSFNLGTLKASHDLISQFIRAEPHFLNCYNFLVRICNLDAFFEDTNMILKYNSDWINICCALLVSFLVSLLLLGIIYSIWLLWDIHDKIRLIAKVFSIILNTLVALWWYI